MNNTHLQAARMHVSDPQVVTPHNSPHLFFPPSSASTMHHAGWLDARTELPKAEAPDFSFDQRLIV
jgi:hypothetical protein